VCVSVCVAECDEVIVNSTLRRQNCCELVRDITQLYLAVMVHLFGSTMKRSVPGDHVRVLGVFFSSDLSLDKHVTAVSAACSPAQTSPRITGRRLYKDARARIRHVAGGLL